MLSKLKKFWGGETSGLTAAAFIVGAASLASRLFGVLRDRALASTFGAGPQLDAYFAAFRVPDFLYNLIILGALSAGFIPIFSEYLERRGEEEAWKLASQVISVVCAVMATVCLVFALLSPVIVPFTVPGFTGERLELTVRLSRIMFLSPFFLGLSGVMGGILQAKRRFVAFALAPVFYNICIIAGVYLFAPQMGVEGVAWGVVLGAFVHCAVQTIVVLRLGLKRIPWPSFQHEGVRRILKLMLPRTAGLAVSQLNLVVLLVFASALTAGSVSVLELADNLQSFPVGIIGISYAVAAFPLLTKFASLRDKPNFTASLDAAARKIMFFILPFTALFLLLRLQIVRLALGAGVFDWDDTLRTAMVLGIFVIALLGQSLVALLARAFYATQNTWTPLWISVIGEVANASIAYSLRDRFGINGLAVAFTVSSYINCLLLFVYLQKSWGPFKVKGFFISAARTGAASAGLIAMGYPVRQLLGTVVPLTGFVTVALQSVFTTLAGVVGFLVVAWVLKSPELAEFTNALRKKLLSKKLLIEGAEEAQGL